MDFTITQISFLIVLHFLFGVCPSVVEDKEKEKDALWNFWLRYGL